MSRRLLATAAGSIVGLIVGAALTLSLQGGAAPSRRPATTQLPPRPVERTAEPSDTMLAWVPGMMPAGFERAAEGSPRVRDATLIRSGTVGLTHSRSEDGNVVDDVRSGFAIPLEIAAVRPSDYLAFVPPAERIALDEVSRGRAILGSSSADLRRLGVGSTVRLDGVDLRVAAIWPDELLGAHEVLVSTATGRRLGVTRDRYALIDPVDSASSRAVSRDLEAIVESRMQIRRPGETPYFRHGDAVLPPVSLKELFGEFAARPDGGGFLELDREWMREHLATRRLPFLGRVRCNRGIIRALEAALEDVRRAGLGHLVRTSDGCFSPRFINRDPDLGLSHHSWGVAFDINAAENPFGHAPRMDRRLVEIFREHGFTWGGNWVVPDGMHFEYQRAPR